MKRDAYLMGLTIKCRLLPLLCLLAFVALVQTAPGAAREPVVALAELVERSRPPTVKEIAPYREGLMHNRYRVVSVEKGRLDADEIVVAQWAILDGKPLDLRHLKVGSTHSFRLRPIKEFKEVNAAQQSVTLGDEAIFLDVYFDVRQEAAMKQSWAKGRYGPLDMQMRELHLLRGQLRLVVLGDSRAEADVDPSLFYQPENATTPMAYSLARGSTGLGYMTVMMRDYMLRLPRLEWVVHNFSTKMVDGFGAFDGSHLNTTGMEHDRKTDFADWAVGPDWKDVTLNDFSWSHFNFDDVRNKMMTPDRVKKYGWGQYIRGQKHDPKGHLKATERHLWAARPYFEFFDWEKLGDYEACIAALSRRGVQVLAFNAPMWTDHEKSLGDNRDLVSRPCYARIMGYLRGLEATYPNFHFYDLHKFGDNPYVPVDYGNPDHLSPHTGAPKFTKTLLPLLEKHKDNPPVREGKITRDPKTAWPTPPSPKGVSAILAEKVAAADAPAGEPGILVLGNERAATALPADALGAALGTRALNLGFKGMDFTSLALALEGDASWKESTGKRGTAPVLLPLMRQSDAPLDHVIIGVSPRMLLTEHQDVGCWDPYQWNALQRTIYALEGTWPRVTVIDLPVPMDGLPGWAATDYRKRLAALQELFPYIDVIVDSSDHAGKLAAWLGTRLIPDWRREKIVSQTQAPACARWRTLRHLLPAALPAQPKGRERCPNFGCWTRMDEGLVGAPVLTCTKTGGTASFVLNRPARVLVTILYAEVGIIANKKSNTVSRKTSTKHLPGVIARADLSWSPPDFTRIGSDVPNDMHHCMLDGPLDVLGWYHRQFARQFPAGKVEIPIGAPMQIIVDYRLDAE